MNPIVKSEYELYLESPEFDELRKAVLNRDNYKCKICGNTEILQIHHLTYLHVYHEKLEDLVCLCKRCHSTYHAIDNMKKYIEERYRDEINKQREQDINKQKERIKEELKLRNKTSAVIIEEIKAEYAPRDYAKNGDLDMCSWTVLSSIISAKCKQHNDDFYINKTELRDWFLYRRYELLLRCINKGLRYENVRDQTKFNPGWLYKWYNKEKLESKLKEEQIINDLRREKYEGN